MRKLTGMLLVALLSMGIYSCGGNGQKAQNANNDKQCCEHKHEHGKCDGHHHDKKCGECPLQLTEEQKAKAKELRDKLKADNAPIMESLKTKNEELHKLLKADEVDLNAANALVDEIYTIKANLKKAEMANQLEFNKLLTPEQKAKLKEMPCHHHHGCCKDGNKGCCKDGKAEGCCKDKKEGCCKDKKEGCCKDGQKAEGCAEKK
ncbi:MAG: Spy/CpxP family protein refolding chaperone [Bacteroidales bacterium]|nr:Spy/CpxP family protein refolding chaperone [Bacteroidales bacterium]